MRCLACAAILAATVGQSGAALTGPCNGNPESVRLPIPPEPFGELGNSLAANDQFIAIGDPKTALPSPFPGNGAVVVYRRTADGWEIDQVLTPPPGVLPDNHRVEFGESIALCGNWLAVTADSNAWLCERTAVGWIPRSRIRFDGYPHSWATSDGVRFAIATWDSTIVLEREPGVVEGWITEATLGSGTYGFGGALAISGDVLVTARYTCSGSLARVFRRTDSGWAFDCELPSEITLPNLNCFEPSISTDGQRIAVSVSSQYDRPIPGYVRIFERSSVDRQWHLQAHITHPSPQSGEYQSSFGNGVAIRGDRLVVGSPLDDQVVHDGGAAYSFRLIDGQWRAVGSLVRSGTDLETFGYRIALLSDAVVITGSGTTGPQGGVVYSLCAAGLGDGPTSARCWPGIAGLFHYIELFYAGSLDADMNADSRVTVGDLFEFLAAWSAGCAQR